MFQLGGSEKGFQGDLTDNLSPVNLDRYRILGKRHFKLGFATYAGTGSGGPGTPASQYWANNDFKSNYQFSIDVTKWYPKDVRFNDNITQPTTRGLFMFITYAPISGGQFSPSQFVVGLQYCQEYIYEDA